MNKLAFGAIIKKQDPRDYDLDIANKTLGAGIPIPDTFRPDWSKYPVYSQGKQPACGSHSGATLKVYQEVQSLSPRYVWNKIKKIDGYPIEAGTDINSIFKAIKNNGVCDFDLLGNNVDLDLVTYANPTIPPDVDLNALNKRISSYAITYNPTIQQIKESIYINGAVVCLFRVGKNMYTPSWKESDILPLSPNKYPMDGGHFVVLIGYENINGKTRVWFRNSWGTAWGVNGDGYFDEDYLPYVNSIGTAIDFVPDTFKFNKDLKFGMKNDDVKQLQKRLGVIQTGYFGSLTLAAVIKYQLANGIFPPFGYVGSITRASLNK